MTKAVASPSVRALASRRGLDLDELARRLGRETIALEDIENAGRIPAPEHSGYWEVDHAAYGPVIEEPVSRMARAASRNLAAAQAMIPAVTHHEEADIGALEEIRRRLKPDAEKRGVRLTALAFHVAILTKCLCAYPRFNASLSSDGNTLILKRFIHVGIAVDTPRGLVVPVIRNADRKGILDIADEILQLASAGAGSSAPCGRNGRGFDDNFKSRRHRRHGVFSDRQPAGSRNPGNFTGSDAAGLGRRRLPACANGSASLDL